MVAATTPAPIYMYSIYSSKGLIDITVGAGEAVGAGEFVGDKVGAGEFVGALVTGTIVGLFVGSLVGFCVGGVVGTATGAALGLIGQFQ